MIESEHGSVFPSYCKTVHETSTHSTDQVSPALIFAAGIVIDPSPLAFKAKDCCSVPFLYTRISPHGLLIVLQENVKGTASVVGFGLIIGENVSQTGACCTVQSLAHVYPAAEKGARKTSSPTPGLVPGSHCSEMLL